jgi:hypothetical protein
MPNLLGHSQKVHGNISRTGAKFLLERH